MDTFLSDTMQIINAYPDFSTSDIMKLIKRGNVTVESIRNFNLEDLKNLFIKGMQRSLKLFGDHCFRRSYGDMRRAPINKALFEMWGSMLAMINENEYTNVYSNQKALKTEYYLLLNDISFQNLISRDSWKYASVQKRFEKIDFLISKYKK